MTANLITKGNLFKIMKQRLSLFLVLFLLSDLAFAGGGWPQPQGSGYFKLYEWWVIADQHYTDNGSIDPNITNGIFNTSFYAEYGLTDKLTVVANIPVFSRAFYNNTVSATTSEIITPGEAVQSIGDIDIGLLYGLWQGSGLALSATLQLGLPTGSVQVVLLVFCKPAMENSINILKLI